jgi:hypothetical protein
MILLRFDPEKIDPHVFEGGTEITNSVTAIELLPAGRCRLTLQDDPPRLNEYGSVHRWNVDESYRVEMKK